MTPAEKKHFMARLFPMALSASLHVLVITAYCLFVKSVYALTEDFYVAYLTAGGFSDGATHLVHYNHCIHPFLTWPVYQLFLLNDGVNWYYTLNTNQKLHEL